MCVLSFWFAVVSLRWVLWSVVVAESCVWVWVCCVVVGLYQGFCCVGNDVFQGLDRLRKEIRSSWRGSVVNESN